VLVIVAVGEIVVAVMIAADDRRGRTLAVAVIVAVLVVATVGKIVIAVLILIARVLDLAVVAIAQRDHVIAAVIARVRDLAVMAVTQRDHVLAAGIARVPVDLAIVARGDHVLAAVVAGVLDLAVVAQAHAVVLAAGVGRMIVAVTVPAALVAAAIALLVAMARVVDTTAGHRVRRLGGAMVRAVAVVLALVAGHARSRRRLVAASGLLARAGRRAGVAVRRLRHRNDDGRDRRGLGGVAGAGLIVGGGHLRRRSHLTGRSLVRRRLMVGRGVLTAVA
jgi:hypothetical protein